VSPAEVFLALRLQLAAQLGAPPPREAVAIMLGQMALETGRFRSVMNYNLGGIKCSKSWPGCWQHFTTTERLPMRTAQKYLDEVPQDSTVELVERSGDLWTLRFKGRHPVNRFVAFGSLDAAIEHHVAFLLGRYRSAVEVAVSTRDAEAYVTECHRLGYFTGAAAAYRASVRSLAREYARTRPADPAPVTPMPPPEPVVSVAASVPAPVPERPATAPSAPRDAPRDAPPRPRANPPTTTRSRDPRLPPDPVHEGGGLPPPTHHPIRGEAIPREG
jgi:hypothetical protein